MIPDPIEDFDRDCSRMHAEQRAFDKRSEFVELVRSFQCNLTDEQRLDFWQAIQGEYCKSCGRNDPRCQCWNDE